MDRASVIVSDAHLAGGATELAAFVRFLATLPDDVGTLVLLGDIFALWVAHPAQTLAHHQAVLAAVAQLRARRVRVLFVEGNREFGVARWQAAAFDAVLPEVDLALGATGRRILLTHGDRINPDDWQTAWLQRVLRSGFVLRAAALLPTAWGVALSHRLERSLRRRHQRFKREVPRDRLARFARTARARGFDAAVIGHLHVEMQLDWNGEGDDLAALTVMPDWGSTHRALRIEIDGTRRFIAHEGGRPSGPAVTAVVGAENRLTLSFETVPSAALGSIVQLDSGHGGPPRRGLVVAIDSERASRLTIEFEPGAPIQVGDRLAPAATETTDR